MDEEAIEVVEPGPKAPAVRKGEPAVVRPRRPPPPEEDEDFEDEEPRPRRKRLRKQGKYADCPNCGNPGDATPVGFTWWGGLLGPKLFSHVQCRECRTCYNGRTGNYNTTGIIIYTAVGILIGLVIGCVGIVAAIQSGR